MVGPVVVVAGAAGDLGRRIVKALVLRGAAVRALVRPDAQDAVSGLAGLGAEPTTSEATDFDALVRACTGATCVVSALNGLRDVIVDRQTLLLKAAVEARAGRFISSDFALDFTKTEPGGNRNLDLRREFMARADRSSIPVTSILNGAFMDMLGAEMPLIQRRIARVLCWRDPDQPLDFTTKDNVAEFAAAIALAGDAPRILRIAGDTVSARSLAAEMSALEGRLYKPLRVGGMRTLDVMIGVAKVLAPQPKAAFPPWQGLQYVRDMFGGRGKLEPLDNARHPEIRWTSVREHLMQMREQTSSA